MVAATRVSMADIGRQRRYETDLSGELTPRHTVGQAIRHYLDRVNIPDSGLRWAAFSRGVRLDSKQALGEIPDVDTDWTVMPEVSAGRC
jgi:hypothetical protein